MRAGWCFPRGCQRGQRREASVVTCAVVRLALERRAEAAAERDVGEEAVGEEEEQQRGHGGGDGRGERHLLEDLGRVRVRVRVMVRVRVRVRVR